MHMQRCESLQASGNAEVMGRTRVLSGCVRSGVSQQIAMETVHCAWPGYLVKGLTNWVYQRPSEGPLWHGLVETPQLQYRTFDHETREAALEANKRFMDRRLWVKLRLRTHADLGTADCHSTRE